MTTSEQPADVPSVDDGTAESFTDSANQTDTTAAPVATETIAPQPAPTPPQLYQLYPDALLEERATFSLIAGCTPDSEKSGKWGSAFTAYPCLGSDFTKVAGTLSVVTVASVYSLSAAEVAGGSFTIVGVITSVIAGVETVVAVIASSPVTVPAAIAVVTGVTVYALINNPPTWDPRFEEWRDQRFPNKVAMAAAGQLALNGAMTATMTDDQTRMSNVDADAFIQRWEIELRFTSGPTAVILEDHPGHAANTYLALSALGFKVLGVYPSCTSFQSSGVFSQIVGGVFINLYVIDEQLLGGESGSACAVAIRAMSPGSFILHYSSLGGRDWFGDQIRATNQLNGAEGVTDAIQKKTHLMRFIDFIVGNADKIVR